MKERTYLETLCVLLLLADIQLIGLNFNLPHILSKHPSHFILQKIKIISQHLLVLLNEVLPYVNDDINLKKYINKSTCRSRVMR